MKTVWSKLLRGIFSLFLITLFISNANADSYSVKIKGISAGTAVFTSEQKGGVYSVKLALYPNFLARLKIGDLVESSTGTFKNGHFYPTHYRRTDENGNTLLGVKFVNTMVDVQKEGKFARKFGIEKKGQDPLSQIVQIQHDLKNAKLAQNYYLVTDKSQKKYAAQLSRDKQGVLVTLTEQPSQYRQIKLWFSNDFSLIKMQKNKNKNGKIKEDFSITQKK